MSYTPPIGNSVNFTATGRAYTPPIGSAVNFEPLNQLRLELPITVALQGAAGFVGPVLFSPVAVSAQGLQQTTGVSRNFAPIEVAIVGEAPLCGAASIAPFVLQASGMASVVGVLSVAIEVGVQGSGSAAVTTGEIYFPAGVVVGASGVFTEPYAGSLQQQLQMGVSSAGYIVPFGKASAVLKVSVASTGNAGLRGQARFTPISAQAFGVAGRTGSAHIAVSPCVSARAAKGASGTAQFTTISVSGSGATADVYRGSVSLSPLAIYGTGYHPVPRRNRRAVFVRTENQVLYVR